MWMLFVLVATMTSADVARVDLYTTQEDCEAHKLKFEREFTVAYPGDRDYAFACVFVKKEVTP